MEKQESPIENQKNKENLFTINFEEPKIENTEQSSVENKKSRKGLQSA